MSEEENEEGKNNLTEKNREKNIIVCPDVVCASEKEVKIERRKKWRGNRRKAKRGKKQRWRDEERNQEGERYAEWKNQSE